MILPLIGILIFTLYFQLVRLSPVNYSFKNNLFTPAANEVINHIDFNYFNSQNHSLHHKKQNSANINLSDLQALDKLQFSVLVDHYLFNEISDSKSFRAKDRQQLFNFFNYSSPIQNAKETEILLI